MNRTQLLQSLIDRFNYKSYLEIGCSADVNFAPIKIDQKVGVDPAHGGTHRMTSDEYFANHSDKFDLIFIDGLHLNEQVDLDIKNSLEHLNPNGIIVMHDCNPAVEDAQHRHVVISDWNGDVWKSFVRHRAHQDIDMATGNFDHGCGIIRVRKNSDPISVSEDQFTWSNLVQNRQKWLRLMSYNDLMKWIEKEQVIESDENFAVTIIIPVLNRPKNVKPLIESYLKNSPIDKTEMLFVTSSFCVEEIDEIKKYSGPITIAIAPDDVKSWAKRINWGINYSKTNTRLSNTSSWILCGADDIVFHKDWFDVAKRGSTNFVGILGTNDLGNPACTSGSHSTHPIVSRQYIEEFGTLDEKGKLCYEGYIHNYVDAEMVATARKRKMWKPLLDCIIEHNHPAWKKGTWDEIYQIGKDTFSVDQKTFVQRISKFKL